MDQGPLMSDYSSLCAEVGSAVDCALNDPSPAVDPPRPAQVSLSRIQRLIAGRMLASKQSKPCFYQATRADVTDLMAMRHTLSKALGVKVTSNAFLIHALALAAREYPLMVGRFVWTSADSVEPLDGDGQAPPSQTPEAGAVIEIAEAVNVGFAVSSAQGLVAPVIKHAHEKSLGQIAREEKLLTDKARSNKLALDDLEGETIGLSNLGAYDIDSFIGIVPPPASTILAVGKVSLAAVPRDGRAVVRKMMSLSLAVDHRVVQSDYAARFLQSLAERLEAPQKLVD
jgi:pyruvate dehydrogenase E2 component (dihydrolipoamide acetyltransferase)